MTKEEVDTLWNMYHPQNRIVAVGQSNKGYSTNLNDEVDIASIETLALYTGYLLDSQERDEEASSKL